jgi:transcriptional pleiotropic regulator of transition state genes
MEDIIAMKFTGLSRRIDDLGRVVIPKDVRKQVGFFEDDILDIYIDGDMIILKKTSVKVENED